MRNAVAISAGMHVGVFVLAWVGLPSLARYELPTEQPIIVELVTVAEKTNPPPPKPQSKPAEEQKQAKPRPAPPPPPAPAPPPPETAMAPVPKPAPVPPAPPPPEPKQVANVPPPAPKPAPQAKPKPDPKPQAKAPPRPAPKPAPPKPVAKKPPPEPQVALQTPKAPTKKPQKNADFDQVLNSLNKIRERVEEREETEQASLPETPTPAPRATAPNRPDQPLTVSELDYIRAQIQRCWIVPIGAKGVEDMLVDISVEMNQDGTVRDARIVDFIRMQSDTFFRTVAESARRAVLKCSPLEVPAKKFDQWRSMTLRFNPKDMFGS